MKLHRIEFGVRREEALDRHGGDRSRNVAPRVLQQ
jgi:hypothetical protein